MVSSDLCWMTATDIAKDVAANRLRPIEIAEEMIHRVEKVNPDLNAIVQFDAEQVRHDAENLTRMQMGGMPLGPLHGVPFTIKDLTAVRGLPTTFGLKPMRNNIAESDAAVVQRLRNAGGLFLGKTNTPESGYYGVTDNHLFGPTHNPWKKGHTAGGSSGGAAAAVVSGLGPLAEGSDGAGSVRIPCAMCGAVGLKPTTGVVPQSLLPGRYFDWIYHGPITRTVSDNALMLDVIAGPDDSDPLSIPRVESSYLSAMRGGIHGLRVAWSPNLGLGHVEPDVASVCADAVACFETLGASVTEATPSWGDPLEAMWNAIWLPGLATQHDALDWNTLHGQVDDDLIELMEEGEQLTGADYGRAEVFRGTMWNIWTKFMQDYDILVSPTVATAAFSLDSYPPEWLQGRSLRERLFGWLLTYPYNMLNNPAISIPAGFTSDGRPVGLQIAARHREDALLLRVAANVEHVRPWADQRPTL